MKVLHKTISSAFGSWLYDRYKESGLTIIDLTKEIGISKECLLYHVRGTNCPTASTLFLYARYFEENIYTLIDLVCEDLNSKLDRHKESLVCYMQWDMQTPFARWLTSEVCEKRLSIDDIADAVGLLPRTVTRHMACYSTPDFAITKRYADAFDADVWDIYELTLLDG